MTSYAWLRIKSKPQPPVKQTGAGWGILTACLLVLAGTSAHAADEAPSIQTYPVRIAQRASSDTAYLIEWPDGARPQASAAVLLRDGETNIMGLRILRVNAKKHRMIAKVIRQYGEVKALEPGHTYTAVQRASKGPAPRLTRMDTEATRELQEFDKKLPTATLKMSKAEKLPVFPAGFIESIADYDPELDAGSSPLPNEIDGFKAIDSLPGSSEGPSQAISEDIRDDDAHLGMAVRESALFDTHDRSVSLGFGMIRNNRKAKNSAELSSGYDNVGFGLRYAQVWRRGILMQRMRFQDSMTWEGSVFFYRILGYTTQTDSYMLSSWIGTARYNIHMNEDWTFFGYLGMMKHFILSSGGTSDAAYDTRGLLQFFMPAVGVGSMLRLGPHWYTRVDLGLDTVTLGLVLRF